MTIGYESHDGLIVVTAKLHGPAGIGALRLAIDTGATRTIISTKLLAAAGYDLAAVQDRTEMITGSGVEYVSRILIDRLSALGVTSAGMFVISYELPPGTKVDGLLGVDFFADRRLIIDFRSNSIE